MRTQRTYLWALLAALPIACTDLSLPEGAQVSCASDEECPGGFVCQQEAGRCIDAAVIGKTPIDFEEPPALEPPRVGVAEGFSVATLRATFTEEPVEAPSVTILGQPVSCGGTRELVCEIDAAALELPEGIVELKLVGRDAAANLAEATLPLMVDKTAPGVADAPPALYEAAPDNPIARPQAITHGTTARITVALTEPLGAEPEARLADTEVALDRLDDDGLADLVFTFGWTFRVEDVVPEGARLVELSLQDSVGNLATVEVDAGILVDTVAPPSLPVTESGAVIYRRAPWGVAGDAEPRFEVEGVPGLEAGLMMEARTGDAANTLVLGRTLTAADGSFRLPLIAVDAPRVQVVAWDAAGNPSVPARVRDIEWTAGFARKVLGSRLDNPHALYAAPEFSGSALLPALQDELDPAPLLEPAGAPVRVVGGATWTARRREASGAPNRGDAAVAYHAALGQTLVFGGYDTSVFTAVDDTYLIDGERFVPLPLSVRPPPGRARMAYDTRRDRLVLQSHMDRSTWVFEDSAWRPLALDDPGTNFDALAYDPRLDAVVGYSAWDTDPATWLFQGEQWQRVDAAGPGRRVGLAMAWDEHEQRVLLYGGAPVDESSVLDDLWAFDGQTWQALGRGPTLKWHAALTGPEGALWLVGGSSSCNGGSAWDCQESQVVYQWLGSAAGFAVVSTAPARTPAVLGAQLGAAWERASARLVTFGGGTEQTIAGLGYRDEFWLLEGTAWRRVTPSTPASVGDRTDFPALLYDAGRGGLIFAGGAVVSGAVGIRLDTQLLAGDAVTELADDFGGFGFTMVRHGDPLFRSALGVTLIAGGRTGYLGSTGWVLSPATTPARTDMGAAWFETRGEAILFGGRATAATSETWRFNGSSYSAVSTATAPPARSGASLAFDSDQSVVLMFGGSDGATEFVDTWAFDGSDWSLVDDAGPALSDANLVYDRTRGLAVLIGAVASTTVVYELIDGSWRAREVRGIEGTLTSASAGFDVGRARITVAGGMEVNGSTDAVYTWDGSPALRAAALAQLDLRARGTAPDAVLEGLEIEATAGAWGYDGAAVHSGVGVQVWQGGWQLLGENQAPPEAPAPLAASLEDPLRLGALDPARLHLAVVSSAPNGSRQSELALRALAVTLRYREP